MIPFAAPWCQDVGPLQSASRSARHPNPRFPLGLRVFRERWLSLLAAAVLPGTGRDAAFRLSKDLGPDGFAVETGNGGQIVGHLDLFDERLIEALHVVACLARSPEALANVLEAAGQVALERAGTILDERVPE
jgi:hypothetical protein